MSASERVERERVPAGASPVGVVLLGEMFARDWTRNELARRMGGDFIENCATLDFIFAQPALDEGLVLGDETAAQLERATGISATFWMRTDAIYREWRAAQRVKRQPEDAGGGG